MSLWFFFSKFLEYCEDWPLEPAAHGVDWVTIIPLVCLHLMLHAPSEQSV